MEKQHNTTKSTWRGKLFCFIVLCMITGFSVVLTPNASFAQVAPPEGTVIGNQATATYEDANGNIQTVTSNSVETIVQQVYSVTITNGKTLSVSPGGEVVFSHTITNNGNGDDAIGIAAADAAGDNFDFDSIQIYADADGDGVADDLGSPITTTPAIPAGGSFNIVIVGNVPSTATNTQTANIDVTITGSDGATTDNATNTAVIEEGVVLDLLKSLSPNSGGIGDIVTVTLTVTNKSTTDATNITITDPLPAGFEYAENSAEWSGGDGTGLTDDGTDGDIYEFNGASGDPNGLVTAVIPQLNAGQQATITFDVIIEAGFDADQTIENTAFVDYGDVIDQESNTTTFTVGDDYNVTSVDEDGTTTPDGDGKRIIATATQGQVVNFVNVFKNLGSAPDRFNITIENSATGSDYPEGTIFTLYKADGSGNPTSRLSDSNNDGITDIGPIDEQAEFTVVLQVQLPTDASGGGPYHIDVVATSIHDGNAATTLTDELTTIEGNSVDITNTVALDGIPDETGVDAEPGEGITTAGEADPVVTNTIDPGTTTTFTLFINNTGPQPDNYNLSASTDGSFSNITLPAGWTVEFMDPATGDLITNTGTIAADAAKEVTVEVTVPDHDLAGTKHLYLKTESFASGALDVIHDAVTVNTKSAISLVAPNSGQISPGATITYQHTLKNVGNVDVNTTADRLSIQVENSEEGFTAVLYWDKNNDGVIDSGDELIATDNDNSVDLSTIGDLIIFEEVRFIVQITANSAVDDATTNTTTISVVNGDASLTDTVKDITKVISGNLVITKLQSLTNGSDYGKTQLEADPGNTIYYKIMITNNGTQEVTNIVIKDATPPFTTMKEAVSTIETIAGSVTVEAEPASGNKGAITVKVTALKPGETVTITFAVQINDV